MYSFELRVSLTHHDDQAPDSKELERMAQRLFDWLHETDGAPWIIEDLSIDGVDVEIS